MNEFLQKLYSHYNNYRINPILDKASWHISHTLKIADNIKLLHLNRYFPGQNPVQLLWREFRRKYFQNVIFQSMDKVEIKFQQALSNYDHQQKEEIKKLAKGFLFI